MERLTDRSKEIPLPCADSALFWAQNFFLTNLPNYATINTVDRQYADCYQRETEYYQPITSHQVAASAWWGVEFLKRVWNEKP